ncbi:Uncharacterized membrane protein [Kaistella treverensis]|uniref:Uncharacterized membrane protein n=1 Tax=Kaistella treverensis TaxID=631455 RepID=A0A1I3NPP9_9FLAO|nr:hypothetical protein [Kaistella treverensis]SFJ11142.1 Uncharacterized membrane protein [Kaistella treverensis]
MDQTHIHLVITHLPIFGSILGGLVLAYGLWTKSNETKVAAYGLFFLSSIGAGIAYITGEPAEESVEHLPGIFEVTIERHEDFAIYALVSLIILGLASILGVYLTLRKSPATRTFAFVIFLISLVSFGLVARTGFLGGQIRHSEIVKDLTIPLKNIENQEDDDD